MNNTALLARGRSASEFRQGLSTTPNNSNYYRELLVDYDDDDSPLIAAPASKLKFLKLKEHFNDGVAIKGRLESELKETRMRYMESLTTIKAMSMEVVVAKEKTRVSQMEYVGKYVIQRFLRGFYRDSTMYPHQLNILNIVDTFYESRPGEKIMVTPQLLNIRLNLRLQRNKIAHQIKQGYKSYIRENPKKAISIDQLNDDRWHYGEDGTEPMNNPVIVHSMIDAFYGKNSDCTRFTLSQVCYGAAKIEFIIRNVDLHKEENTDNLKLLHDQYVQEVQEHIDMRPESESSLLEDGGEILFGKFWLVKGSENVEDSMMNQHPDPKSFVGKKNSLGF